MAQTGYTPIALYNSATASAVPTAGNLIAGELAINTNDGRLFYKDSAGVVQTIASKNTFNGIFSTISVSGNSSLSTASGVTLVGTTSGQGAKFEVVSPQGNGIRITSTGATGNTGGVLIFSNQVTSGYKDIASIQSNLENAGTGTEAGGIKFSTATGGTLAERMRIDSYGNVGIGTSSPASKLNVYSTTGSTADFAGSIRVTNASYTAGTYAGVLFETADTLNSYITAVRQGSYGGILTFGTNDASTGTALVERMRIDSSGNLLVGTTTANNGAKVSVLTNGTGQSFFRTDATAFSPLAFYSNTSTLQGYITCTGAGVTAYITTSDYRLKENIEPMTGSLDKVSALKPVTYTWKANGSDGQGFIAHELQAICPDAVYGEKDAVNEDGSIKPQGIDTSFLIATLVSAIQEQQVMIKELQAKVAALEAA